MGAVISRLVLASMVRRAYELTVDQREADALDRLLPPALLNISRLRNDAVMRAPQSVRAYYSWIGRKGWVRRRRELSSADARNVVCVREARRAGSAPAI